MDRDKIAESFTENFLTIMPTIHKRLMRDITVNTSDMSKQQYHLLFMIQQNDGKPMSFYSEKMLISKPNLSVITDKMIQEGFIERDFDPSDRRVIILKITKRGEEIMRKARIGIQKHMKNRLDSFSDKEISRLNEIIIEMKCIFDKLES